jgi:hypothetical protein
MVEGKTSTFVLHHDRCKPAEWTLAAWFALAKYVETGDLAYAAVLSRHGLQLVASEKHEPVGGTLEHLGYVTEGEVRGLAAELDEVCEDDVTAVIPIYRGPTKYAASWLIGDDEGNVEGREYEIKDTEAEATAYIESIPTAAPEPAS